MCGRDDDPTQYSAATRDGREIEVGDVLMFLGSPHLIQRIEPYRHRLYPDEEWRIAHASGDWRITLVPFQLYEIGPTSLAAPACDPGAATDAGGCAPAGVRTQPSPAASRSGPDPRCAVQANKPTDGSASVARSPTTRTQIEAPHAG